MGNVIIYDQRFPSSIWKETNPSRNKMKLYYQLDVMNWKEETKNEYDLWKKLRKLRFGKEISFCTWNVQSFKNANDVKINCQDLMNFISNDLFVDILCLQEYPLEINHKNNDCDMIFDNLYDKNNSFLCKMSGNDGNIGNKISSNANKMIIEKNFYFNDKGPRNQNRCCTFSLHYFNNLNKNHNTNNIYDKNNEFIIRIIHTHLDVWDPSGKTRMNQIMEILENYDKLKLNLDVPTFLCGDLNQTKKDYTYNNFIWNSIQNRYFNHYKTLSDPSIFTLLKQNGFISSFELINQLNPSFTVWTGTTVDWILIDTNSIKGKIDLNSILLKVHPILLSDHLPISISFIPKYRLF